MPCHGTLGLHHLRLESAPRLHSQAQPRVTCMFVLSATWRPIQRLQRCPTSLSLGATQPFTSTYSRHLTVQLPNYSTTQLLNCSTAQLLNYPTIQLFNYSTTQLLNCSTTQLPNYSTIQLFNDPTIRLFNHLAVELLWPFLAQERRRKETLRKFLEYRCTNEKGYKEWAEIVEEVRWSIATKAPFERRACVS